MFSNSEMTCKILDHLTKVAVFFRTSFAMRLLQSSLKSILESMQASNILLLLTSVIIKDLYYYINNWYFGNRIKSTILLLFFKIFPRFKNTVHTPILTQFWTSVSDKLFIAQNCYTMGKIAINFEGNSMFSRVNIYWTIIIDG